MTIGKPQTTDFTKDVLGRYICNGLDEALHSIDRNATRADGSSQSDAQAFDIIVIGGGSFGPVMAQHVFGADKTHSHRILVLDAGSLVLTEHFQNYPPIGLGVPGPVESDPFVLRNEVWGLPWRSDVPVGFTGLAYCLGGRSVFFGGWSPQLLDTAKYTEMPTPLWPASVTSELNTRYFAEAAAQIGTDETNDFVHGPMHDAMRKQLFDAINNNSVQDAIKPVDLPLTLNLPTAIPPAKKEEFKLEAPLAVQSRAASGLFPFNKFSAVPLLIKAARTASNESTIGTGIPDDVKKRFMVVPHCRVIKLGTSTQNGMGHVTDIEVETYTPICGDGGNVQKQRTTIPVGDNAKVVIALGTIESTRLALLSFQGIDNYGLIGQNLMAHLRSNLTIRIPRGSLTGLSAAVKALQASALFVKGSHKFDDDTKGYFHLQITAAGLDKPSADSEAELFKKIPDWDGIAAMQHATDDTVVITIRGIGELQGQNPGNSITLSGETDEVGVRRAFVTYNLNAKDQALWNAMDKAADDVAKAIANGQVFWVLVSKNRNASMVKVAATADLQQLVPYTPNTPDPNGINNDGRRDGMGTTHHEAGPLWMGTNPNTSVTDSNARFHFVDNAYVAGPALLPTVGSPNPMLSGVALARRLADHLTAQPFTADPGFTLLFDGADTGKWRMSTINNQANNNPGAFLVVNRSIESLPGNDLGLLWHSDPTPPNFILKLEWLRWRDDDNSGVFIRFPNPNSKGYNNTAYVGVHFGFEVQIDQLGRDDGAAIHKTGAIYGLAEPNNAPLTFPGQWNAFEIHAQGQHYTVFLNGTKITEYDNPDLARGLPSTIGAPSFIGLQTHTGRVAFRKIQIKAI